MQKEYFFEPGARIWKCVGHDGIAYSDGEESEEYIRAVVANAHDVSSRSEELIAAIRDWPSDYHLSPSRHNLLRPFDFRPADRILELGGGCGAMTRYLGEKCASVVSVEGSTRRAGIAADRCRDLPAVSIYCDNILDFRSGDKFDYVVLVGVLEYCQLFSTSNDPVTQCLRHAHSFLRPGGQLIIAIENKLGLKYFSGCAEDHLGIPFFGVSDLYKSDTPITFGRSELSRHLQAAGMPEQTFYYPFPDYKLPGLILSETALGEAGLNIADLLLNSAGKDYPETRYRCFDEGLAWRAVVKNDLVREFANSFLIFASDGRLPSNPAWHAKVYSRSPRSASMEVETTFASQTGDRGISVKKKLLLQKQCERSDFEHTPSDSVYIQGELLTGCIRDAMAREAGLAEIMECYRPWLDLLKHSATGNGMQPIMLPNDFIDCIPSNIVIERTSNEARYFDAEWASASPVPFAWILIRGAIYSLSGALYNRKLNGLTYRQFIMALTAHYSIETSDDDFALAAAQELAFSRFCGANRPAGIDLLTVYDQALYLTGRFVGIDEGQLHREVQRMKKTVSWRVTGPLRAAWNGYIKVRAYMARTFRPTPGPD